MTIAISMTMLTSAETAAAYCSLTAEYLSKITAHLHTILQSNQATLSQAATLLAEQIKQDRLIHVAASGGHSNLATQEIFFRAGGLTR